MVDTVDGTPRLWFSSSLRMFCNILWFRVKPSIDQFIDGMDSVGNLYTHYIKKWARVFVPLFVFTSEPLTVNQFRGLYAVVWAEEGSNRRAEEEEDTIYCFDQFLVKVLILQLVQCWCICYRSHSSILILG